MKAGASGAPLSPAAVPWMLRHCLRIAFPACLVAWLSVGGCGGSENSCDGLAGVATCGPRLTPVTLHPLPPQHPASDVKLYVDRSASMAGYLDSLYSSDFGVGEGSSSLRRVLNQLFAASDRHMAVFGFGDRVTTPAASRQANQDVIATLVRPDFYNDNNTRLEDVLDSIARDTTRQGVHLIITDGRRGDGGAANAQWKRIGELARAWSGADGIFALAAIQAPFHQVRGDKAGCWSDTPTKAFVCPLYVIAFAPRGSAFPVLQALRDVGHRLYVAPTFSDSALTIEAKPAGGGTGSLNIEGGAQTGRPLHLLYAAPNAPPAKPEVAAVSVVARLSGGAARYAADDSFDIVVRSVALAGKTAATSWQPVYETASAWATPAAPHVDSAGLKLLVPLKLKSRQDVNKVRYQFEIRSTGRPAWLAQFESSQQGDAARTYGLSALFAQLHPTPTTLTSFYVSIY